MGQRTSGSVIDSTPAEEHASSASTDGVDVESEQLLGPLYGHYKGYCGVYGGETDRLLHCIQLLQLCGQGFNGLSQREDGNKTGLLSVLR
jgi:hypothetical protein